jgi:HD-GYP domain-containing protein (c-di-GMP phosphodiesterase class II)
MDQNAEWIYNKLIEGVKLLKKENETILNKLHRNKLEILRLLIKIVEEIDPYTKGHSLKVYRFVIKLAKRFKLTADEIDAIGNAALLHDVGKIVVDKEILNKKGKLTEHEFAMIKMHSVIGADIARESEYLKTASPHILYHHARYDGGGYPPHNFKYDEIPLGARLIAVADSYDAMTSNRPYRKAYSKEYAIEELKKNSGKMYDPKVVNAFLEILKYD